MLGPSAANPRESHAWSSDHQRAISRVYGSANRLETLRESLRVVCPWHIKLECWTCGQADRQPVGVPVLAGSHPCDVLQGNAAQYAFDIEEQRGALPNNDSPVCESQRHTRRELDL